MRARLSWRSVPFVFGRSVVRRHPILLVTAHDEPPAVWDTSSRCAYKFHGIGIERERIEMPLGVYLVAAECD